MELNSNLSFTLYDIASHVVPGSAAFLVIYHSHTFQKLDDIKLDTLSILIFGYVIGHLFYSVGSILTKVFNKEDYDRAFAKKLIKIVDFITKLIPPNEKSTSPEIKDKLWKSINKTYKYNPSRKSRLALFQISDVIASKDKFEERNVLLAKEGFYRSLLGFTFCLIVYLLFVYQSSAVAVLTIGAITLKIFFYQYEHFRRIKNNQIYIYALLKLIK